MCKSHFQVTQSVKIARLLRLLILLVPAIREARWIFRNPKNNLYMKELLKKTTQTTQRILKFDVADAKTDRFICTMKTPFNPLFKLTVQQVLDYIYLKRPSLKYRDIVVEL